MFISFNELMKEGFNFNYWDGRSSYKKDRGELRIPLPGVKKGDIDIEVVGRALRIKFPPNDFLSIGEYTYKLGPLTDVNRITSTFVDGILFLSLPYKEEEVRQISID